MGHYLWKRTSEYQYSGHPTLKEWMPLSAACEENTFATREEAYAAYGRYVERTMAGRVKHATNGFGPERVLAWIDMTLVEVAPPGPQHWTEVNESK